MPSFYERVARSARDVGSFLAGHGARANGPGEDVPLFRLDGARADAVRAVAASRRVKLGRRRAAGARSANPRKFAEALAVAGLVPEQWLLGDAPMALARSHRIFRWDEADYEFLAALAAFAPAVIEAQAAVRDLAATSSPWGAAVGNELLLRLLDRDAAPPYDLFAHCLMVGEDIDSCREPYLAQSRALHVAGVSAAQFHEHQIMHGRAHSVFPGSTLGDLARDAGRVAEGARAAREGGLTVPRCPPVPPMSWGPVPPPWPESMVGVPFADLADPAAAAVALHRAGLGMARVLPSCVVVHLPRLPA